MAKKPDHLAGSFETENTGGLLTGFLAEEDVFDRRSLWRLGSWGAGSVGAVVVAVLANQSAIGWRHDQVAAADLTRQSQQIQSVARESQNETRRLASAIDTLNSDRDRLYSRVTVLEQGLDSVTGAIARQSSAPAATQAVAAAASPPAAPAKVEPPTPLQNQASAPAVSPVVTTIAKTTEAKTTEAKASEAKASEKLPMDTTVPVPVPAPAIAAPVAQAAPTPPSVTPAVPPATPLMASKSLMAPPDAAASKLIGPEKPADAVVAAPAPPPGVVASVSPADEAKSQAPAAAVEKVAVQRTEFGVDVGGANSVAGLRALWHGLLKWRANAALTTLQPIIVIKEGSNGLGMQLRLVAGPLDDAAAAAKICAGLIENQRPCQTTVFDGQHLAMNGDEPEANAKAGATKPDAIKPAAARPTARRRSLAKHVTIEEPPPKPEPTTLSSFFSRHLEQAGK
jgi:hypothetical protein